MNLESWVKYSGEIPTIWSISFITTISLVLGFVSSNIMGSLIGFCVGLGFAISGFLLVILPNLLFIRKMINNEQKVGSVE